MPLRVTKLTVQQLEAGKPLRECRGEMEVAFCQSGTPVGWSFAHDVTVINNDLRTEGLLPLLGKGVCALAFARKIFKHTRRTTKNFTQKEVGIALGITDAMLEDHFADDDAVLGSRIFAELLRIAKDELRDMYNSHTKCNFSASSIMTDIQRLQLKYERGLRCIYNGMSVRGVIVGIKKKTGQEEEEEPPAKEVPSRKIAKQELLDPYGLDFGIPCTELDNDDIIRRLKDKEEEVNDLKEQFEKMRLEFEAYKKQFPVTQISVSVIDDNSDEEIDSPTPPKSKSKPVKSVLSIIDDSDEESDEEESAPINAKSHKIMKALECDFIE
jgi:hypothetical protein